jgi:hypothetical protein
MYLDPFDSIAGGIFLGECAQLLQIRIHHRLKILIFDPFKIKQMLVFQRDLFPNKLRKDEKDPADVARGGEFGICEVLKREQATTNIYVNFIVVNIRKGETICFEAGRNLSRYGVQVPIS